MTQIASTPKSSAKTTGIDWSELFAATPIAIFVNALRGALSRPGAATVVAQPAVACR